MRLAGHKPGVIQLFCRVAPAIQEVNMDKMDKGDLHNGFLSIQQPNFAGIRPARGPVSGRCKKTTEKECGKEDSEP